MDSSNDNSVISYKGDKEHSELEDGGSESEYSGSGAESSGSESEYSGSESYSSQSTNSSDDDMPLVSLAKQTKRHDATPGHNHNDSNVDSPIAFRSKPKNRNKMISDDENTDDHNLNASDDKTSVSNKSTQNISFIESNNNHLGSVKLEKQKQQIIAGADEEENGITSNNSANKSCASSISNLSSSVDDNLSSNASASKSSASTNVNP